MPGAGERRACNVRERAGACDAAVPASIERFTPLDYRNPAQLPAGGVLVVGASATGVQLADEIHRSGRPVTLSVGEHVRLPRTYRGRDVLWWMEASGIWNQRYDEIDDLTRARALPSPQLVGTPERATLDLNASARPASRSSAGWLHVRDGRALFSGGLRNQFALADLKMDRLLDTFDEWARSARARSPTSVLPSASNRPARRRRRGWISTLASGEIRSIVWATGFRPDYSWLDVPVVDSQGPPAARRRGRRCAGAVRHWGCPFSGAASRRSSTARRTTRGILIEHLMGTWRDAAGLRACTTPGEVVQAFRPPADTDRSSAGLQACRQA